MQTDAADAGNILERDHRELDQLLANLLNELARDAPDAVASYHKLDLFWARLAVHIRAEHVFLFPALLASADAAERAMLETTFNELRHDHDFFMKQLARAIKALRLVPDFGNEDETYQVVRQLINEVAARLTQHNHREEETIYPRAVHLPTAPIQRQLANLPNRF